MDLSFRTYSQSSNSTQCHYFAKQCSDRPTLGAKFLFLLHSTCANLSRYEQPNEKNDVIQGNRRASGSLGRLSLSRPAFDTLSTPIKHVAQFSTTNAISAPTLID